MANASCLALSVLSLALLTCSMNYASSANQTGCVGMFTTGMLKADNSSLSSTSYSADLEPYKAVVNTSRAWCAESSDTFEYLQVNLGKLRNISSIAIQGYKPFFVAYVTKFIITYTKDDVNWNFYEDNSNNIKVFLNSPADENEVIIHRLPSILSALRIRIKPQEWQEWICMRIELFTCDPVNGGFSEWSSWTYCNDGNQIRSRSCVSPSPARGGLNCSGDYSITRSCTLNLIDNSTNNSMDADSSLQNFTDPCSSHVCKNATSCISFINMSKIEYICNCTEGFSGKNCSHFAFEVWGFVPSQDMHKYENVVLPIAVSVASTAIISGSFGIIYFIFKAKLSKIVLTSSIAV